MVRLYNVYQRVLVSLPRTGKSMKSVRFIRSGKKWKKETYTYCSDRSLQILIDDSNINSIHYCDCKIVMSCERRSVNVLASHSAHVVRH